MRPQFRLAGLYPMMAEMASEQISGAMMHVAPNKAVMHSCDGKNSRTPTRSPIYRIHRTPSDRGPRKGLV